MEDSSTEYAAVIGLDWADREHAWSLQVVGRRERERGVVAHTPEAIEEWACGLAKSFPGAQIAVALEQSRGAVLFALTKYRHLTLYPIHPARIAHYRRSFRPSGAKDDPGDADLLLDYISRYRDQVRPLQADREDTRALQFLVEARRRTVDEKTRVKNRLTSVLKQYFPQIVGWFSDVECAVVLDLLERWPTLEQLQRTRRSTLDRFLTQHRCGGAENVEQRWRDIQAAVAATTDAVVVRCFSLNAICLVRQLRELKNSVETYDQAIHELTQKHPDFDLFKSFPGAGDALVPRLIAAFGSQRDRWSDASELQCYSGIAPVLERSGKQQWIHIRWACPKFVRQTFHEWALHSLNKCAWAKSHYEDQLKRGKGRHAAIRSVAFKWLRIAFRCWKDRCKYDSELYEKHSSKRASSGPGLLHVEWKSCGSFSQVVTVRT
jgi:transposase